MKTVLNILFAILYVLLANFIFFNLYPGTLGGDAGMVLLVFFTLTGFSILVASLLFILVRKFVYALNALVLAKIILVWLVFELLHLLFIQHFCLFGVFAKSDYFKIMGFYYSLSVVIAISATELLKKLFLKSSS